MFPLPFCIVSISFLDRLMNFKPKMQLKLIKQALGDKAKKRREGKPYKNTAQLYSQSKGEVRLKFVEIVRGRGEGKKEKNDS